MSNGQIKCKWAKIAQIRALPKIPNKMADMEPDEITETIKRMEHREKVRGLKYKYACGT